MVRPLAGRVYMDASALAKLVITEQETPALRKYLAGGLQIVASRLASVELRRIARRQSEYEAGKSVETLLESLLFIELDGDVARTAGSIAPSSLRSLDAIHLASALLVRDELDSLVTYDDRLATAARDAGLTVEAPQ